MYAPAAMLMTSHHGSAQGERAWDERDAGPRGNTVRFLAPLVASDDDIALGLDRFEAACADVLAESDARPTVPRQP